MEDVAEVQDEKVVKTVGFGLIPGICENDGDIAGRAEVLYCRCFELWTVQSQ